MIPSVLNALQVVNPPPSEKDSISGKVDDRQFIQEYRRTCQGLREGLAFPGMEGTAAPEGKHLLLLFDVSSQESESDQ